jgi:KUP system potassium uptake protein
MVGAHGKMSTSTPTSRYKTLGLSIGALGIVFGDIGTSPLYAIRECFHGKHAIDPTPENIFGVLSLVFWSLTMVISIKYLTFIMRADNRGEGGVFALLALVPTSTDRISKKMRWWVVLAALFGAALLYGDGIITPAISVLSAVEGLEIATHAASPYVTPITCTLLLGLFLIQRRGTAGIAKIFGPIMVLWFLVLEVLGLTQIFHNPEILTALDPRHGLAFFARHHTHGFVVLASVVLVITGGEAIYADMGHFGRRPIRLAWFTMVFPALILNYFGQGALLLSQPELAVNPFYGMVPKSMLLPMVALSTMATIIASQAMISGVFSLTRQAVQLGFFPRVHIVHTSGEQEGQIYIPGANTALMLACIGLVLFFQNSSSLAAAYGIAVTANMMLTSIIYFCILTLTWKWPLWRALLLCVLFLCFDLTFFGSNLLKLFDGGWLPFTVAIIIVVIMTTWKRGRTEIMQRIATTTLPLETFLEDVANRKPTRVPGTAVVLASIAQGTPVVLLHHFKHNQVLHEQVVLLSIQVAGVPYVSRREQLKLEKLEEGFYRLIAQYGFMQTPNVPDIMRRAYRLGLTTDPARTSFYMGRETLIPSGKAPMMRWRKRLFTFMSKNALNATAYFGIPPGRVVELGVQIDL